MQTILNILTIIAFCFSSYTFIKEIIEKRKNISVDLLQVVRDSNNNFLYYIFCFQILNKSRLPIAISRIQIQTDKNKYELFNRPIVLFSSVSKTGNTVTGTKKIDGSVLPITISSFGAERMYFSSYKEKDFFIEPKDKIKIIIGTNRGKITKNIAVPNFSDLLELYPSSLPEKK